MAKVNFGELGSVNFPEEWSEDQLRSHLQENGEAIRKELLARAQAVNAQEAQDEAGPDTAMETLGSMAGSVVQGASATLGGAARTANRALNAAAGWYEPDLVETPVGRQALATEETPEETAARVNSGPGIKLGNAIEEGAAKVAPTLPDSAAGFWTGDVPQGVGSAVAMVGPGLLAGPAAGLTLGFGAEADDAFSEEIRRQQEKGETPDMDKALAKSLGYASVATAIESGLGAGRIIRKLKSKFGGDTVEETVNSAVRQGVSGTFIGRLLKGGAKDAAAGFTEEALQRMSEDLIVHGSVNVDGMMSEGAAGGVVQAILGLPANAKARRKVTSQTARDAASAGLSQTGSIVADMSNAAEVLTPDLTEADVSDLYADPEAVGTQSETDAVISAAEVARKAAQAEQTLPTEPVATEGTGEDPAAVGAVEPIAEPSTPSKESNEPAPAESEGSTEPGVRQGDTGNMVPGVPAGSDNGGDAVPADRDQSSSTTGAVMDGGSSVPGSDAAVVGTVPGTGVSTTSELAPSVRDQTTGRGIVPESGAAEGNQRTDPVRPGVQTGNGPAQRAEESEPVLPGKIRQAVPAGVAPAEVTANSSKDIASGMQAMGQAAGSNLRDQLWDAHQKGKTKVAGIRERMLVVADAKGVSKTDRAAFDAFIDEYTKKEDAEREAKRPKNLGKNRRGFDVFEDENGVRSYVDGGVRVTEDVQIIPTRDGNRMSVDVSKRGSDYLTEQEWRDKQGQAAAAAVPDRVRRFNLGKKRVTVEFPDNVHAALFGFWSRIGTPGVDENWIGKQKTLLAHWLGIPKSEVGKAAARYSQEVKEQGRAAVGDDVTIQAPKLSGPKPVTTQGTPTASDPKDAKLAEIQAKRDAIKKRLRDKLGGVSSGIDPEIAVIAAELAVTYVEEGVVRFPDFAKRVKEEMGDIWDSLKTYLHGAWASAGTVQPEAVESTRAESAAAIAALDSPKEEAQPPADTAGDKVLDALNKAIDATSTADKYFSELAGVSYAVANTLLKAVRAAYVGGKALTAAIRDAISDYRAAHPKTKLDDNAMSDWLSSQVTGAAEVSMTPEGKRTVTMGGTRAESEAIEWLKSPEFLYVRETEAGRMEAARKIIDSFAGDLRAALRFVTVPDQMSGVTASISEVTAAEIANRAHEKSVAAANTPDMRQWEALRDQAIEVAKGFLSGQGQGLQAGNQVAKVLGAGAAVAEYQDRIRMLRDKALAGKFPEVTAMKIKDWLDEAARRAVAEIKTTMRKADNVVARLLKQARADYGETWSEIMQASAAAQGGHRREIFRRILNHPKLAGIDRAGALELANLLGTAWEKERMAIFRREFRKQVQLPDVREEDMVALQAATPAFVRQINLGLWDNEAFRNAVAPQFGVRSVTQEASSRIYAAAQEAQRAPEGPQRQTKYRQLAQLVSREAGVPPMEVIRGWWYASVLSGSGTQARNFIGNAAQLVDNFVAFSARSPQDIPRLISGLLRGMAQNATGEFGAVFLRGQESTGRASEDIRNAGSAAETLAGDARLWARLFSNSKYVGRFMSAVDSFFYAANAEMMAQFMAVRAGRTEGVSTRQEMNDYISSALKLAPGDMAAAMAQAQAESAAGQLVDRHQGTVNRRAYQILAEQRPADIRQEMHRFALEATLNNIPEGVLGAIATSIINLRERFPVLTPVVPFVRISANVTNMLLDHSPAALVKLIAARPDGYRILGYDGLRYPNRRLTEEQFQQLRAKVVIGGTATIALAIAAGMHLDDDEPPFQITGSLDSLDFEKRRQLNEQGIKPYQIRFGNVGVDYRQTPLAMMLTMIGSVMDGIRYSKFDEKEESVKYSALMASGATVIVDQSFLSGLQSILDRGTYGGKTDIGSRFARGAASTIGGMMPRMFKDFDQMVNPDLKQAKGFWDNLLKEMPVARWSLQSRKNVLGEDVQRQAWPWSATISTANPDPVWQELNRKAQAGVFLPVPSASARILKNGERVKMTDEEFDEYTTLTGEGYRKALEKDLSKIQKMTPEQFEVWIKATLEPIRANARAQVR